MTAMKHGHNRRGRVSRTYRIWTGMKNRCLNPRNKDFRYYGRRGIMVCERWLEFENFLADMGEAPTDLTLDRTDTNGNYEPNNCAWATRKEQAQTTRRKSNYGGLTIQQWADVWGINYQAAKGRIYRRLRNG